MITLQKHLETDVVALGRDHRLPKTIAASTRRVYDVVSSIYPLSTYCFHSRAHKLALDISGIQDGMRILEVATGSGEMFRRLVGANPNGETFGLDLSPRMAARTQRQIRRDFPNAKASCQAVDCRQLPFRDEAFDVVVCCFLLELLGKEDIRRALSEIRRVLQPSGSLTLVCIGENAEVFNNLYRVAGSVAPAFWGRQVEQRVPEWLHALHFRISHDRHVRQSGYPSRVLRAVKRP